MPLLKPYPSAEHIRAHDIDDGMNIQSPVKLKVGNTGGNDYIYPDYDASTLPDTGSAPNNVYKQVVEGSDGKEYLLRSGNGWRENHDGTVSMWSTTAAVSGLNTGQQGAGFISLPVAVSNVDYRVTASASRAEQFYSQNVNVENVKSTNGFEVYVDNISGPNAATVFVEWHLEGGILA